MQPTHDRCLSLKPPKLLVRKFVAARKRKLHRSPKPPPSSGHLPGLQDQPAAPAAYQTNRLVFAPQLGGQVILVCRGARRGAQQTPAGPRQGAASPDQHRGSRDAESHHRRRGCPADDTSLRAPIAPEDGGAVVEDTDGEVRGRRKPRQGQLSVDRFLGGEPVPRRSGLARVRGRDFRLHTSAGFRGGKDVPQPANRSSSRSAANQAPPPKASDRFDDDGRRAEV
mmetsp:Transcript_16558/g.45109  ORF Transcript_16558/g.45109 Transcript_16558/m.45109 type:complete len:225 (-) Transcript_16558:4915-5589(-)